jgi:hypothetical protein
MEARCPIWPFAGARGFKPRPILSMFSRLKKGSFAIVGDLAHSRFSAWRNAPQLEKVRPFIAARTSAGIFLCGRFSTCAGLEARIDAGFEGFEICVVVVGEVTGVGFASLIGAAVVGGRRVGFAIGAVMLRVTDAGFGALGAEGVFVIDLSFA